MRKTPTKVTDLVAPLSPEQEVELLLDMLVRIIDDVDSWGCDECSYYELPADIETWHRNYQREQESKREA